MDNLQAAPSNNIILYVVITIAAIGIIILLAAIWNANNTNISNTGSQENNQENNTTGDELVEDDLDNDDDDINGSNQKPPSKETFKDDIYSNKDSSKNIAAELLRSTYHQKDLSKVPTVRPPPKRSIPIQTAEILSSAPIQEPIISNIQDINRKDGLSPTDNFEIPVEPNTVCPHKEDNISLDVKLPTVEVLETIQEIVRPDVPISLPIIVSTPVIEHPAPLQLVYNTNLDLSDYTESSGEMGQDVELASIEDISTTSSNSKQSDPKFNIMEPKGYEASFDLNSEMSFGEIYKTYSQGHSHHSLLASTSGVDFTSTEPSYQVNDKKLIYPSFNNQRPIPPVPNKISPYAPHQQKSTIPVIMEKSTTSSSFDETFGISVDASITNPASLSSDFSSPTEKSIRNLRRQSYGNPIKVMNARQNDRVSNARIGPF